MTRLGLFVGLAAFALPVAAQSDAPRFEVVSIKPNKSVGATFRPPRFEGATFAIINLPIEPLILMAFGVAATELVGGPAWIRESGGDRFDITARMREGAPRQDQLAMVRQMLEDRFALRSHREMREMPVYLLTKLNEGTQLGSNLRPAPKQCLPSEVCGGQTSLGKTAYIGAQWPVVLRTIVRGLDRRLIDRTGLSGAFDFELTFGRALSVDPADGGVDLFTAVRQQLGLKLELSRSPLEVLVIDSAEPPTPN